MFRTVLDNVEGDCEDENRLAALAGGHPAGRKAAAVANPFNFEQDRLGGIAGEQKIGVKGVRRSVGNGANGGDERLGDHLTAVDARPTHVGRMADEAVGAVRLEVEQRDKICGGQRHDGFRRQPPFGGPPSASSTPRPRRGTRPSGLESPQMPQDFVDLRNAPVIPRCHHGATETGADLTHAIASKPF